MEQSQRMQFCQGLLYFFENFVSVKGPAIRSWFEVPTIQGDNAGIKFGRWFPHEHHLMMGTLQLGGLSGDGVLRPWYCFPYFLRYENCSCWVWKLGSDACPLNLVCLQYFFPNGEQLIGEESRSISLHYERSSENRAYVYKDHGKILSYQ